MKPLSVSRTVYLRSNTINAREITERRGLTIKDSTATGFLVYPQNTGWLKLNNIDLNGIVSLELNSFSRGEPANYSIEVRLGSENGIIIGKANMAYNATMNQQAITTITLQSRKDASLHDLYFVIVADKKDVKQRPLLRTIKFNPI
jgi:hypothetical protein